MIMQKNTHSLSVIHIVSSLNIGGAERFVLDLCQVQQKQSVRVAIMSLGQPDEPLQKLCDDLNIPVFNVLGHRLTKWLSMMKYFRKFDVIHCHSPYPLKLMSVLLPLLSRKKIIYTRHGANPLSNKVWKRLHKFLRNYIDSITFVSQEGAEVFQQHHGWPAHKKHVIDNGVDLSGINIQRQASSQIRLGSVGRMVELKNQKNLLQAVALLTEAEQKKIALNFYGDGPCFENLKATSKELALAATVMFHGMVNDRDKIYNVIDTLVVTSETEGLSLAIIEAMAYQCGIIATNVGGTPKLVDHNVNGWLFDYDDAQQLAGYIQQLLQNPMLASEQGSQGQLKIAAQFSLQSSALKYLSLYQAKGSPN